MSLKRVANGLALAAAPTFALMAVVTMIENTRSQDGICSIGPAGAWPTGMAPMYVLMSIFHATAWLKASVAQKAHKTGCKCGPIAALRR
jgi:hypothetical protein